MSTRESFGGRGGSRTVQPRLGGNGKRGPALDARGLPLHPQRSIYYDAKFNPTGAAPPGMPYREKRESFRLHHFLPVFAGRSLSLEKSRLLTFRPPGSSARNEWPEGSRSTDEEGESGDDVESSDTDSGMDEIPMPYGPPPVHGPQLHGRKGGPSRTQAGAAIAHTASTAAVQYSPPPDPKSGTASSQPAPTPASAVISAAPQLRDLKREATEFVPSALTRKRKPPPPGSSS